jgi:PAS domain S-box-containing protein
LKVIHTDDRERVAEIIRRTLAAGESYESEYRLSGTDGTVRHLVSRGRVERDASGRAVRLPAVVMDITAQRRAEERERQLLYEAAAANAKFRAFFEQGAIFAGIMDVDGTVLEPNRAAWEGCGFTREEIIGKPFCEGPWWTPSADLVEQVKAATAQAAAGQAFRAEMPYFVADGSQRIADVVILPIKDDAGRVMFLAPTGTDITLRRQMEDSLRRLAADLSEADHRKDEFLATLAHELRNPLAPLRNGLQVMRLAGDNGLAVEQARTMMERQLGQMVRLVDDLLDVSRITRNKLELRRERVELDAVVRSAIETSRPLIEAAAHELTVTLPPASICLEADLTRLAQVFSNLLNNAAKYTRPGGHIWLTAQKLDNEILIGVKDNGMGIRPDMLSKVFDMFTQADRSLERTQGGLGIGLTLVKRLVEMHRGSVEARSEGLGHGSEFVVHLPILDERPLRHDPEMPAENTNPEKRRILVVDDNVDSAQTLGMMLSMMGNEIHMVYDGIEAVEAAASFRPDLILLDIGLPKLNGYEACRRIREQPWGNEIVIIACTGWGQEEDIRRGKEAGFDRHMVKPVDPEALNAILAEQRPAGTAANGR